MLELSYSKVRTYLSCPWLYKLKFIEDWKAPPSPEASLGISIHKALEKFHGKKLSTEEELRFCLDDAWERPGYSDSAQELEFYDRACRITETYHRQIASQWDGAVLDVEKDFQLEMPEEGIKLMGTVDRLDRLKDGTYALVEYKTHPKAWDTERLAGDLQMTIYHYALAVGASFQPMRLFFFFVSVGEWRETSRGLQDWDKAKNTIRDAASGIRQNRFDPDTRYCAFCDFRRTCAYSTAKNEP